MNNKNYQKEMDSLINSLCKQEKIPTLLLHSCCAPCSSYVIEYLSQFFAITVFYYNPNIYPEKEYIYRKAEQKRLINAMPVKKAVKFLDCDYESEKFLEISKGYEDCKEGGARCARCFNLRLNKAAATAKDGKFDYFATTLTISPLKNAPVINNIGLDIAKKYDVLYLASDFKKKNGYKRSIVLSKEYNLYRQNYCGCVFSQNEARIRDAQNSKAK